MIMPTRWTCTGLSMAAALALATTPARAHIIVDFPNGGEQFEVGSVVTITWHIFISHNLLNWDLAYSTVDPGCAAGARSCMGAGPWTTIALNLPPGSNAVGSVHTYDWTVPDDVQATVWVRVIMDNSGTDYTDFNDLPFSIVPAIVGDIDGDGMVSTTDLLLLLASWGGCLDCDDCPADLDGDCMVGTTDLLLVLANWS